MNFLMSTVTTLTPKNVNFWDMASWHMAYNASVAAMNDTRQPKIALRRKAQHEYFMLGKDYAEHGIANNPTSYVLYQTLGNLYRWKLDDHCDAAIAYDKAAHCPGGTAVLETIRRVRVSSVPRTRKGSVAAAARTLRSGTAGTFAQPRKDAQGHGRETSTAARTKGLQNSLGGLV